MMKWIIKKYLNKRLEDLNYQILSLEQELGYADYLTKNKETELLEIHENIILYRDSLRRVIDNIQCNHDYEEINQHQIDFGMGKLLYLRCKKCGREKRKVI
jgi:hypothetical protein